MTAALVCLYCAHCSNSVYAILFVSLEIDRKHTYYTLKVTLYHMVNILPNYNSI